MFGGGSTEQQAMHTCNCKKDSARSAALELSPASVIVTASCALQLA